MGPWRVLLIGYGNPGRLDDGLGPALAGEAARWGLQGLDAEAAYQLVVEDAAEIATHDAVVLADAATEGREPFYFKRIAPEAGACFSTHSVSPGQLVSIVQDMFGRSVPAYLLGIRGYEFNEYEERLSEGAARNLGAAAKFLKQVLSTGCPDAHLVE